MPVHARTLGPFAALVILVAPIAGCSAQQPPPSVPRSVVSIRQQPPAALSVSPAPGRVFGRAPTEKEIAEREQQERDAANAAAHAASVAQMEEDQRIERQRKEASARAWQAQVDERRAGEERERLAKLSADLGGLMLAKHDPVAVSSVQICVQLEQMAIERDRLAREHRIASSGGAIDLYNAHGAAEGIDDAREEAKAIAMLVRKRYGRQPLKCAGGVKRAAQCVVGDECTERVAATLKRAWHYASDLLDGASLDEREAALRAELRDSSEADACAVEAQNVISGR